MGRGIHPASIDTAPPSVLLYLALLVSLSPRRRFALARRLLFSRLGLSDSPRTPPARPAPRRPSPLHTDTTPPGSPARRHSNAQESTLSARLGVCSELDLWLPRACIWYVETSPMDLSPGIASFVPLVCLVSVLSFPSLSVSSSLALVLVSPSWCRLCCSCCRLLSPSLPLSPLLSSNPSTAPHSLRPDHAIDPTDTPL